ncbi:MAG: carbohydrate ABC transporter permease [Clostridia bacterium]|nr:carbohydrate ABC transporter permease [Clostridia bacterium]
MTSKTASYTPSIVRRRGAGQVVLTCVMMLFVLVCLLPFVNVIAISLSSKSAILRGAVSFWPVEFSTKAYEAIFKDSTMFTSLWFTVKITVIYTFIAMVLTILMAFPLSMRRLKGRKIFMLFIVFTMYFSGGTIPIYLNVKQLGMLDTQWSLIIPGLISTFNIIILKNFFDGLPYELNEAAYIDGANDYQILLRIYLPLSFSSLATLALFYAVGKWNSFSDALYYISSRSLQPLQLKLYNLIKGGQSIEVTVQEGSANDLGSSISESIESATIIFATLPILLVYPFVQRYFVAGVTMGAVKG